MVIGLSLHIHTFLHPSFYHCKNNYRLKMINLFIITTEVLYHSSVFFIISLSEAVYLRSFGGLCACNIFVFCI